MHGINMLMEKMMKVKYFNRWIIFFSDLFFSIFSTLCITIFLWYVLKSTGTEEMLFLYLFISGICSIASFFSFQIYKGIIRHSTFTETGRLALASLLKVVLMLPLLYWFVEPSLRNLALLLSLDLFLTFFNLTILRVLLIVFYHTLLNGLEGKANKRRNMMVYLSERTISLLDKNIHLQGFNSNMKGFFRFGGGNMRIWQYPVHSISDQEDFNRLVDIYQISTILFIDQQEVKEEAERLVRFCEKKHLRMLKLSKIEDIRKEYIDVQTLPEIKIEDLLGRDEIKINLNDIAVSLKNRVVLVTGAAGSIGSELCRQLCCFDIKELILFDSAETPMHNLRLELEETFPQKKIIPIMGDVRQPLRVESVFARFHPQYVFHAAAYKHVPLMEENPCEAVYTNLYGTQNVANQALRYDAEKFIMISTDKAVNPTNVMGASKRLAEIYVQSLGIAISKGLHTGRTRFVTTRFGNVLGSNGSVIPRFREQLQKGGPLTVTHPDIIRYFMTIPEACRLVLEAFYIGKESEIFIFDMGTPVKIVDLARRMIELAGLAPEEDIQISFTGLRPGEKLYEELLATKENTIPTENHKIFRAQVREYDFEIVNHQMQSLLAAAVAIDKKQTVLLMKEIIPEFKSNNSEFEELDRMRFDKQKSVV